MNNVFNVIIMNRCGPIAFLRLEIDLINVAFTFASCSPVTIS